MAHMLFIILLTSVSALHVQHRQHNVKWSNISMSRHMKTQPGASCAVRDMAEKNAQAKLQERQSFLSSSNAKESKAFREQTPNGWNAALLLEPYYPCFGTLEKTISARDQWDGGKWICGLKEMASARPKMLVYSLGSNFEKSFEDMISKTTDNTAEIHIYDPTMAKNKSRLDSWVKGLKPNQHFHDIGIKGQDVTTPFSAITLNEAFAENGHIAQGIDILKFDIEGYEYELLEHADWASAKIGVISFELHSNKIEKRLGSYTFQDLQRELHRMESAGYRLYSVEPVGWKHAGQMELAMVHRDWDPVYGFSNSCK